MSLPAVIFRKLLFILTFVMGLITVLAAYGGVFPPTAYMGIPAIMALAFPICAVILAVIIIIDCFLAPKSALLGVVMLVVLCWKPLKANFPLHFFAKDYNRSLSLMTYNVANFYDFSDNDRQSDINRTIEYILSRDEDIVALQEYENTAPESIRLLKAQYPYNASDNNGQALFSKYPFDDLGAVRSDSVFMIAHAYRIHIDSTQVTLINVHLRSIGLTEQDKELYEKITEGHREDMKEIKKSLLSKLRHAFLDRSVQAERIRQYLDGIAGPVIVCGDFNDVPLCYAQRVIMGNNLTDAYSASARFPTVTFHVNNMYFRIDHILCGDGLKPVYTECDHVNSSDHYPVISKMIFTNQ